MTQETTIYIPFDYLSRFYSDEIYNIICDFFNTKIREKNGIPKIEEITIVLPPTDYRKLEEDNYITKNSTGDEKYIFIPEGIKIITSDELPEQHDYN